MTRLVCSFPECGRKHYSKGLCAGHRHHERLGRELKPLRERRGTTVGCSRDCPELHHAKGFCYGHYREAFPRPSVAQPPKPCSVDGCAAKHHARGFCEPHYREAFPPPPRASKVRKAPAARKPRKPASTMPPGWDRQTVQREKAPRRPQVGLRDVGAPIPTAPEGVRAAMRVTALRARDKSEAAELLSMLFGDVA